MPCHFRTLFSHCRFKQFSHIEFFLWCSTSFFKFWTYSVLCLNSAAKTKPFLIGSGFFNYRSQIRLRLRGPHHHQPQKPHWSLYKVKIEKCFHTVHIPFKHHCSTLICSLTIHVAVTDLENPAPAPYVRDTDIFWPRTYVNCKVRTKLFLLKSDLNTVYYTVYT